MSFRSILAAAVAAVVLAGCAVGSEGPTATAPASSVGSSPSDGPAAATITIEGFVFDPARLEVTAGTTVDWTNAEDAFHTVTAGTPAAPSSDFDSGELDTGEMFSVEFPTPGTYPYFCSRHDFMTGEIVVTP